MALLPRRTSSFDFKHKDEQSKFIPVNNTNLKQFVLLMQFKLVWSDL